MNFFLPSRPYYTKGPYPPRLFQTHDHRQSGPPTKTSGVIVREPRDPWTDPEAGVSEGLGTVRPVHTSGGSSVTSGALWGLGRPEEVHKGPRVCTSAGPGASEFSLGPCRNRGVERNDGL